MAWYDSWLKNRMRSEIQELLKADGVSSETAAPVQTPNGLADQLPDLAEDHHDASNHVGRKSIVDDPYFDMMSSQVNFKHKMSRLTNRTLKEVSVRDWLVSAIIQCRVDTLLSFSRPEHKRFEMGFRVVKKDSKSPYSDEDRQEIARDIEAACDAGARLKELHRQMRQPPAAGRGVGDLVRRLLRHLDQLGDAADARIVGSADEDRLLEHEADRSEVARQLDRHVRRDPGAARQRKERRGRRQIQRVAVVRLLRGEARGNGAARARLVHHDDLLAPDGAELVGEDARGGVIGAAGRGVDDQPDGLVRIVRLRVCAAASQERRECDPKPLHRGPPVRADITSASAPASHTSRGCPARSSAPRPDAC